MKWPAPDVDGSTPAARARAELASQLRTLPAFRALLRGVEAGLIAHSVLPAPVLDLGSGDGDFGARALGPSDALGIDSHLPSLAEARRCNPGRRYCAASATDLSLASGALGTVVANSVLEHVPDLERALAECARVLRPGGQLVITAPCHRFTELLPLGRLLRALGLARLGASHGRWFNRRSQHYHLLSAEQWRALLERHGLRVDHWHYYFSPRAHTAFEALHYLGAPAMLLRRMTGSWLPWRNPLTHRMALRWLGPLASPVAIDDGAYVFVIAERLE